MNFHSRHLDPLNGVRKVLCSEMWNFLSISGCCFHTEPSAAGKVGRAAAYAANITVGTCGWARCVGVRSPDRRDWSATRKVTSRKVEQKQTFFF